MSGDDGHLSEKIGAALASLGMISEQLRNMELREERKHGENQGRFGTLEKKISDFKHQQAQDLQKVYNKFWIMERSLGSVGAELHKMKAPLDEINEIRKRGKWFLGGLLTVVTGLSFLFAPLWNLFLGSWFTKMWGGGH